MTEARAGEMDFGLEVGKGLVGKVIQAVFGFVGAIIFARVLGPAGFGGFYLLLSLTELSKRPLLGFSKAVQKQFAEIEAPRGELVGLQGLVSLGAIIIASVGAFVLGSDLASYTGVDSAALFFVLLFASISTFTVYQVLLTSVGRLGLQTWIDTFRSVVTFSGQLLFVIAGFGVAGMAFGLSFGTFVFFPITFYFLRTLPAIPSRETVHSVWGFAQYSIPTAIIGKAYDNFDILLLGALGAPALAGQYEVAYKLTVPAAFISSLSAAGLMAIVSDLESRGETVAENISNTIAFTSLFAIPLFFGALSIPRIVIVTLFGSSYQSAAPLLIGLALFRVLSTQTAVFGNILNGLDRPRAKLKVSTIGLLVNIPLGIYLFFEMGALGVVVATILAEGLRYCLFFVSVSRRTEATLLPRALIDQIMAGAGMFLVVTAAKSTVIVTSWVEVVGLIALGAAFYFSSLVVLSRHFRVTVRGVLRETLSKYRR